MSAMLKKTPPDERAIYLALKNIFQGSKASLRKTKKVRKLITKHSKQHDIAHLIKTHDLDTVSSIARSLLLEEVFSSPVRAKTRFPQVFDSQPAETEEELAPESEIATADATTEEDAPATPREEVQKEVQDEGQPEISINESNDVPKPPETVSLRVKTPPIRPIASMLRASSKSTPPPKISRHVASLFPVYFPLRTQNYILMKVQTILENACFDFAQRVMPDILKKQNWDCPESSELNIWAAEFLGRKKEFASKLDNTGRPLEKLFYSISEIRHTAVHRTRVSARQVEQFILDAESLATLLGDDLRLRTFIKLRQDVQAAIEELEYNKHHLGSRLAETLNKLDMQRAGLDRMEEEAIADVKKEDNEHLVLTGINLEHAVVSLEIADTATILTENQAILKAENAERIEKSEEPKVEESKSEELTAQDPRTPEVQKENIDSTANSDSTQAESKSDQWIWPKAIKDAITPWRGTGSYR
ncbi:hypothetical protein F5884DRAFT_853873 [Xylogone sp. PMI_703]|nr:hypothetical protein F5884DRAFT_853873 [Xylogone sp. PMI_703]